MVLLDALDEDPLTWHGMRERVLELLEATKHFYRVVISCRTQFFPKDEVDPLKRPYIRVGSYICPRKYLSLFNDEQVDLYLSKRFAKDGRLKSSKIAKAKRVIESMGTLRFRPLLLAHIDAFIESENETWNEYTVYEALVSSWLLREENKLSINKKYSITHQDLFEACLEAAWYLQRKGERTLSEHNIRELVAASPVASHLCALDIGGRSLMNRNSAGDFRFSHYTIQEFLVVRGMSFFSSRSERMHVRATNKILEFIELAGPGVPLGFLDFSEMTLDDCCYDGVDFRGAIFESTDTTTCTFNRSDFTSAKLVKAKCIGTQFQSATFKAANLSNACLTDANFEYADFADADLSHVDLTTCVLVGAKVSRTTFNGANLSGQDLTKLDLTEATLAGAVMSGANLSDICLRGVDVRGAKLDAASLQRGDFSHSNLSNSNLKQAGASQANFRNANLAGVNLDNASLESADLSEAGAVGATLTASSLASAKLRNANLAAADLSKANLAMADFSNADLSGANLTSAVLDGAVFVGSNLSNARLRDARLTNCDFSNANLSGADFSGTNFSSLRLDGADLSGTDLRDASLPKGRMNRGQLRFALLTSHQRFDLWIA